MTPSTPLSNSKSKPDNSSPPTLNSITFSFKLKKITHLSSKKWKPENKPSLIPTRSLTNLTNKIKNSRTKLVKLKKNATEPNPSIKNFVPILIPPRPKTKISQWSSRAWRTLWEWPKASSTNPSSREKTSERTTCNWPTKTRYWTPKLTNVWWAFWTMKRSTRTCNNKSRITLLATSKQEPCWTERRRWEVYWTKWLQSFKRLKNKLPISDDASLFSFLWFTMLNSLFCVIFLFLEVFIFELIEFILILWNWSLLCD